MHPFFIQKWELFAPEPAIYSMRMYYRCQGINRQWNDWKDPISKLIKEHQENRFTYRGKLIYVYQGLFRSLANAKAEIIKKDCPQSLKACQNIEEKIHGLTEYGKVNRLVEKLCQRENLKLSHQFSLAKVYPKNFSQRNNKETRRKMDIDTYEGRRGLDL